MVAWGAAMPEPGVYERTAGGGFTLMGEAVYLHKPMLAVPLHRQFEQVLNARSTRKYGTENLAPLNEGKVPRNKLVALAKRYR